MVSYHVVPTRCRYYRDSNALSGRGADETKVPDLIDIGDYSESYSDLMLS